MSDHFMIVMIQTIRVCLIQQQTKIYTMTTPKFNHKYKLNQLDLFPTCSTHARCPTTLTTWAAKLQWLNPRKRKHQSWIKIRKWRLHIYLDTFHLTLGSHKKTSDKFRRKMMQRLSRRYQSQLKNKLTRWQTKSMTLSKRSMSCSWTTRPASNLHHRAMPGRSDKDTSTFHVKRKLYKLITR